MHQFDAIVISDLHLGARNCRSRDLIDFLRAVHTRHLIINGDVFQCPRLRGLSAADLAVLETLRGYGRRVRVSWLAGNHDPSREWFAGLLGIDLETELLLEAGCDTYLVCHGHVWDKALELPPLVLAAADAIYAAAQRIDPTHELARRLKRSSKRFCRAVEALRRQAVAAARRRGVAGVILGHTHVACDQRIDRIHYLNSGCWTEKPAAFVGVRNGLARQYFWDSDRAEPLPADTGYLVDDEPLAEPCLAPESSAV
jgi:UDP-2,3-diacylglucosamine pyrophosphatase LpxH